MRLDAVASAGMGMSRSKLKVRFLDHLSFFLPSLFRFLLPFL